MKSTNSFLHSDIDVASRYCRRTITGLVSCQHVHNSKCCHMERCGIYSSLAFAYYLDDIKIPEQEQCRPGRRAQVYAAKAHMQPSGPHPQYSQANKHLRSGVVLNGHVQPSEPLSREMCASSGCELTSSAQLAEQRQSGVKIQFSCRPMWYAARLQHYHHLFFVSSHPI